ncbi:MAG: hypothetical protein JSS70_12055 [Bacteroidetes bacterium]|nr:hypothetical protein [Bacteroidota bacterium]
MKKIFILLFFATSICYSSLNAQITKGSFFTGGNIGGSIQKVEAYSNDVPYEQKGLTISPVFGKVVKENLVFGLDATISFYNSTQYNETTTQKMNSYGGGIFLRRYKSIGKAFYLFLQSRLGYRFEKYDYILGGLKTQDYKRHTVNLTATPGVSYALNKRLHLETGLGNLFYLTYSHEDGHGYNNTITGKYKANTFNAGVDLNAFNTLYIGFRLFLGK